MQAGRWLLLTRLSIKPVQAIDRSLIGLPARWLVLIGLSVRTLAYIERFINIRAVIDNAVNMQSVWLALPVF
jgi:hypothetical protein